MEHKINEPYAVVIRPQELITSGRRAEVARRILAGHKKEETINWLMETFEMERKQAWSEWRQGYSYIYLQCEMEKEEIRKLNLSRLEELFERAEEELTGKEYFTAQLRNIDMTNKTAGLYTPEDSKVTTGEFTIDLNLSNGPKESK